MPLSAFAHFESKTAPLSINHQGQFPCVTISFNLAPDAALGEAASAVEKAQKELNMPASVLASFQGTVASFKASLTNEPLLILAALITVYIVLGVLYESYIHPITILSTLPSAGVGAILALMLFHQELGVVSLIGIILLIGIVQKNGIMMVDFALQGRARRGEKHRGRDLPGLSAALPADLDDDHDRAVGRPAAGPGHGHRRGTAPSPGHLHGGRADFEPDAHFVHDSCHIHFHGQVFAQASPPQPPPAVGGPHLMNFSRHVHARAPLGEGGRFLMNISAPFIHRPVATSLLTIAVALAGAVAFQLAARGADAAGG